MPGTLAYKLVRVVVEYSDGSKDANGDILWSRDESIVRSVPVSPSDEVVILNEVQDSLDRHSVVPA